MGLQVVMVTQSDGPGFVWWLFVMVGPCERRLHSTILFVELTEIFNAAVLLCGCLRCWEVPKVKNKYVFDKYCLTLRDELLYDATSENTEGNHILFNQITIFKAFKGMMVNNALIS